MINNGKNLYKETNYVEELKLIVTDLNYLLAGEINHYTIPGFSAFLGKYTPKDLKREIYDLIYAKEGVYIFKIDYYTNLCQDFDDVDESQPEETEQGKIKFYFFIIINYKDSDTFADEEHKDEYTFVNYDSKNPNEKEFLKRLIANMQQSHKKVCVEKQVTVKNNFLSSTRYLAYNGKDKHIISLNSF